MSNPARDIREHTLQQYPNAVVVQRGRNWIKHQSGEKSVLDVSLGPLHISNTETEIDTAWEADSGVWQHKMVEADFEARSKSAFNGAPLLEYRVGQDWITLQPRQLDWHNDRGDIQVAGNVQGVAVAVNDDTLRWSNAYGAGRHFEYQAQTARLAKKIILDSYASLPTPNNQIMTGGNPVLRAQFQFAWSASLSVYVDGVLWTGGGGAPTLTTANAIEFRHTDGSVAFVFQRPHAEDNSGDTWTNILLRVSKAGANILVETRTPQAWLENATYPVVIDPTIDPQVSASDDDAYYLSNGSFRDTTSGDEKFGEDTVGGLGSVGCYLRFTLSVPQGSTIDVAYLTFKASQTRTGTTCNATITAADLDDAGVPTSANDAVNTVRTSASAAWSNIEAWTQNLNYDSVDFAPVVEEVVGRPGFASGNHLLTFIDDNASSTDARRDGYSYDNITTFAPILHVEYTEGVGSIVNPIFAEHSVMFGGQVML